MAVGSAKISQKKIDFVERVYDTIDQYGKFIIFNADNVSGAQMKGIRKDLQNKAVILMGKNTLFRKAFQRHFEKNPSLQKIMGQLVGNVGMMFTNEQDLAECRSVLETVSEPRAPKSGAYAQCDVVVEKGVTSIFPEKTSFFQSLKISTKITKGCIEIMSDVNLIKKGDKIGDSEVTLLEMLQVKPFRYKLSSKIVFDQGSVYSPDILDITQDEFADCIKNALSTITAISLGIGHPTRCSAPFSIMHQFKSVLGICLEYGHENKMTEAIKIAMENAQNVKAAAPAPTETASAKVEETKVEEEKEESDDGECFDLFG